MKLNSILKIVSITLALTCGGGAASGAPKAARNWTTHPAVVQVDTTEDIFAIGDAHADPERLVGVLVAANLISGVPKKPSEVRWVAGKSVVVITGDMIDKWKDSLKVIAILRALQTSAAASGGQVIITMGNHEAEFLGDPHGKKTKEFQDELKKAGLKRNDVANCDGDLGKFLCELPIAARVNDWFFSHAGNTNNQTIQALSAAIEAGFAKDGFATKELIGDNSILEARLNDKGPNGLPWFDNGNIATDPQKLLTNYVTALGVHHIVQGHQPGKVKFPDGKKRNQDDLFQRYGLLFLIDSGMSRGVDGATSSGGALHIAGTNNQRAIVICANGKEQALWDSATNPGLNAQHCGN